MDVMGSRVYVGAASSLTNAEHVSVHRGSEAAVCLCCESAVDQVLCAMCVYGACVGVVRVCQ